MTTTYETLQKLVSTYGGSNGLRAREALLGYKSAGGAKPVGEQTHDGVRWIIGGVSGNGRIVGIEPVKSCRHRVKVECPVCHGL